MKKLLSSFSLLLAICLSLHTVRGDEAKRRESLEGSLVIKSQDAVSFVPVVAETQAVAWVSAPIKVDGDLADWNSADVTPRKFAGADHITWHGRPLTEAADLSANLRLARDDNFFYVALEISDDQTPHPHQIEIGLAPADSPLITSWRDVGMRYGADDVHLAFNLSGEKRIDLRWAHVQDRMDRDLIANAFGNEEERRAFIDSLAADTPAQSKIFSTFKRHQTDAGSTTVFECAIPWRMVMPYDPVTSQPLAFNFVVHDRDTGPNGGRGLLGWKPGLSGTYSAAHFATLTFEPPTGRTAVDAYAQLPKFHFLNEDMQAGFSFYNHSDTERKGTLKIFAEGNAEPLAEKDITLPAGYSRDQLAVHSEKVGQTRALLYAELEVADLPASKIAIHAPRLDGDVTIQPVQDVLDAIARIEANAKVLSDLYEEAVAKELDPTYPLAYWTLQQMFIERCRTDLKIGNSRLVLDNEAYLSKIFAEHKAQVEAALQNPERQLKVPPAFQPENLKIKDGFYYDGDRPVFLWGPCLFWYMRGEQPYAWQLGFNSVGPELPIHNEKEHDRIRDYIANFHQNGMFVNASIGSSDFDELKKEHPEVANVDRNNFLSILVQHPIVREEIKKRITNDINFYRDFPTVGSYWLWNEPDYVNFSEMTRQDFIKHLREKYGQIEELNTRWKTTYEDFDKVRIARGLDNANHAPWVDYQNFLNDILVDFFGFLHQTARDVDPTRPTHVKYMCITAASLDIERLQGLGEIGGHDGNAWPRDIVYLDLVRSLYPEKPLSNTEIHIYYRDHFMVSMVPWRLALHGLADGNWWCWHSNHRFSQGITKADSIHALSISGLDVRRLFDPYIHSLVTKPQLIATLYQDVVAHRSWGLIDRLRHEIGPAQYSLGVQPFYATERTIANDVLADKKILIATEASYVKDQTYAEVIRFANEGGTVITLPRSFAANEYNDPRDTSQLIPAEDSERYGDEARIASLGKGRVICIDQLDAAKPSTKETRQAVYRRVFDRVMREEDLLDPVRLVAPADAPDALYGWDIRSAAVEGGYALCALPSERWEKFDPELQHQSDRPIKRIHNLITQRDEPIADFKLIHGANLLLIELED